MLILCSDFIDQYLVYFPLSYDSKIIDGKKIAAELLEKLKSKIQKLKDIGITPKFAVILVGDDPSSLSYVKNKINTAIKAGIKYELFKRDTDISQDELLQIIDSLNKNESIHGILVQMPLPDHINKLSVISAIAKEKDVDGFHPFNVGLMTTLQKSLEPCTPQGVIYILKKILGDDLKSKYAVVLGRSNIVGRPLASMLLRENCTVTILHSYSKSIEKYTKEADIVISAVGVPCYIKPEFIKENAIVIDVGITKVGERLVGDVDFENVIRKASYITKVPGGVGPMTVYYLLENTVKAACINNNILYDKI